MTTERPCSTEKRCFKFASEAALIAGIMICLVGMVDKDTSIKILALNKLLVRASKAAMSDVMITKI